MIDHFSILKATPLMMAPPPTQPGQKPNAPGWTSFMPLILMLMVLYLLMIRPQRQRMKEHQKMIDALETGDRVITSSGILGTIVERKEKTVTVKIAEGVKIEVLKSAIQSVTKSDGKTSTSSP